jgi:hypothetical protein
MPGSQRSSSITRVYPGEPRDGTLAPVTTLIRLFALRRADHASPVAIAVLVAANLLPLVGVVFLGWDLATLVAVYWAENGVVGVFAVLRILTAANAGVGAVVPQPPPPPGRPAVPQAALGAVRFLLAPFFCVHYGMFWFVHGVFVWFALPAMFASAGGGEPLFDPVNVSDPFAAGPDAGTVVWAALVLFVSHGASFVLNWIVGGESRASNPMAEMGAPYARVVVLHLTIIVGAFAVAFLGAPIWALVVMVVLKTGIDLSAHLAERRRAASRMAAQGVAAMGLDAPPA